MIEVKMKTRNGYKIPVEKALKILKRKMETEGVFDELKERRHFVAPSEKKRLAKERSEINQKMRERERNGK
jgi:small subunit ribosomal protein S21